MFKYAEKFDGNLSTLRTDRATTLEGMFFGALSFTGIGVETWNTSSVVNLNATFEEAFLFEGNVSAWDVGNVVHLATTFQYCTHFNTDVSKWDVSKVEWFFYTFSGADVFNRDLSPWDVSSAIKLVGMVRFVAKSPAPDVALF